MALKCGCGTAARRGGHGSRPPEDLLVSANVGASFADPFAMACYRMPAIRYQSDCFRRYRNNNLLRILRLLDSGGRSRV